MSFFFGDGWDLYAATTDPYMGGTYWDSGTGANFTLVAGRFSGSRALMNNAFGAWLTKSSGANDGVHHFCFAYQTSAALSGTFAGFYIQLIDGTTNQCAVVVRQDGAILLTSGAPGGATLATYTGAVTATNTWFAFEVEVVVNNTTGSIAVRKNGNTSNDFFLGSLNTRGGTANNYANKITIGQSANFSNQTVDDFLWRSDPSSVAWVGDVRCYTRMPASDQSVAWTPSGSVVPLANMPGAQSAVAGLGTGSGRYFPFTPPCDGTVGSLSLQCTGAVTANIKCSIYASSAGVPTTVLGSASLVTNPGIGTTTFTFASPVSVSRGVTYFAAFDQDTSSGTFAAQASPPIAGYAFYFNTQSYASFPAANPTGLTSSTTNINIVTINVTPTSAVNAPFVADTVQDAASSYVLSSTVNQSDLYGIAPISVTPASVVGVVTRALAQKSDAGTRNIGVNLKSGSTTSSGTSTVLNTSFGWIWRVDTTDPATSAAWTATGVNNLQIGPTVTA